MFSLSLGAHTASVYIVYIVCTLLSSTEFCNRSWLRCYHQVSSSSWVCGLVYKLVASSCDVTSVHSTRSAQRKVKFVRGKPINTVCWSDYNLCTNTVRDTGETVPSTNLMSPVNLTALVHNAAFQHFVFWIHVSYFQPRTKEMSGILVILLNFFSFGATALIWALACLHETLHFTSVY
jgi:hypothetical protein